MGYDNFNDMPSAKVGAMGAATVKEHLLKCGYQLLPPPEIYDNGGSPVDNTLIMLNDEKFFAEYITRRQKVYRGHKVLVIDSDKIERLKKLSAETQTGIIIYVVDMSGDYNLSDKAPCIWYATLYNLLQDNQIDGVYFPAEDESNGKIFRYFHVRQFLFYDFLTQHERERLKKVIDEMDATRPTDVKTTPPSFHRQQTWSQDTVTAENNLFADIYADEKVKETPVQESDWKKRLIHIKGVRTERNFEFEGHSMSIRTTPDNVKTIPANHILRLIASRNNAHFSFENMGLYEQAVLKSGVALLTVSSETSSHTRINLYLKDIPKTIDSFLTISLYKNRSERQEEIRQTAIRFKKWYTETVLPYADSGNIPLVIEDSVADKVTPVERVTPPLTKEITPTRLAKITARAKQFRKYGLNGQSLMTAIKFVADEDKFDPTEIINFVDFVKSETAEVLN